MPLCLSLSPSNPLTLFGLSPFGLESLKLQSSDYSRLWKYATCEIRSFYNVVFAALSLLLCLVCVQVCAALSVGWRGPISACQTNREADQLEREDRRTEKHTKKQEGARIQQVRCVCSHTLRLSLCLSPLPEIMPQVVSGSTFVALFLAPDCPSSVSHFLTRSVPHYLARSAALLSASCCLVDSCW